jgi:hypothetical protein
VVRKNVFLLLGLLTNFPVKWITKFTYISLNTLLGDGVNDIAAMKTADISAALLTGYGKEVAGADSIDIENERRISKLSERQIGNNRLDATRHPKQIRTREEKLALRKGGAGKLYTNSNLTGYRHN